MFPLTDKRREHFWLKEKAPAREGQRYGCSFATWGIWTIHRFGWTSKLIDSPMRRIVIMLPCSALSRAGAQKGRRADHRCGASFCFNQDLRRSPRLGSGFDLIIAAD